MIDSWGFGWGKIEKPGISGREKKGSVDFLDDLEGTTWDGPMDLLLGDGKKPWKNYRHVDMLDQKVTSCTKKRLANSGIPYMFSIFY